jgi:hypothetical protein
VHVEEPAREGREEGGREDVAKGGDDADVKGGRAARAPQRRAALGPRAQVTHADPYPLGFTFEARALPAWAAEALSTNGQLDFPTTLVFSPDGSLERVVSDVQSLKK